ncbi:MAG: DNA gyrase subunit A [Clostridiales bacterium]|jgi:DNA gyrase subunit A|nr:DNA gyrase subunit A [Clostridiales bacterium]
MSETNQYDKIMDVYIENTMRDSYIDYAMSVIVARALPDVRDGLKPVHRRILYAMNELNLDPSKAYKKSARIVGDTMGKFHPHGESSIYDAMVRMAQDFSIRYPLVDGHGNFGSMDGDGAAAQRYTEARLSKISMEMLADIEKDTVDFIPNYDGEFQEPVVLPSRFPNLLVNGSSGIAVGMATNIPPHNLSECIDALTLIIDNRIEDNRDTDIGEIMNIIKGPDFPTGASILGTSGMRQAYRTGRGKVTVRATASIEPMPGNVGRDMIVVTEIPYQVNKAKLLEKMADLVKERKVEGVTALRDESNREGVRMVIELKKDANANVILNQFYKFSSLQENFSVIMLALVKNEAKILNIKQMLEFYLQHQEDVLLRRSRFELNKAQKRAHILDGLLIALDNIDEVIAIIRSSPDTPTARTRLSERFGLTDEQSAAIVEMRLRALTGLERGRLEQEYGQIKAQIAELQAILGSEKRMYEVIRDELKSIKEKYGDERRTQIVRGEAEIDIEDLIDEEDNVITMTRLDYIKRLPLATYKSQNRGGKGIIGMNTREEDIVKNLFVASTHDEILFFTNLGRVYRIKAYEIPTTGRTARGMAIVNLLNLSGGEKTAAVIPVSGSDYNDCIIMLTKRGIIKKMALKQFVNIKKSGFNALSIKDDDELIAVLRVEEGREIFVATAQGMGIRFNESLIRAMGRQAAGVRAIRLREADFVVGGGIVSDGCQILFVSEMGMGRCTNIEEFRPQNRNGFGLKVYKITPKTGKVAAVCPVTEREELMLITSEGVIIRIRVSDISVQGRYSSGVKLIDLEEGVTVAGVARIAEEQLEAARRADVEDEPGDAEDSEDGNDDLN